MASKGKTFEAVIESTERLNNSVNGNPRWRVFLRGGDVMTTESDASINYGINNPGMIGEPVEITTTRGGKITHVEPKGGN